MTEMIEKGDRVYSRRPPQPPHLRTKSLLDECFINMCGVEGMLDVVWRKKMGGDETGKVTVRLQNVQFHYSMLPRPEISISTTWPMDQLLAAANASSFDEVLGDLLRTMRNSLHEEVANLHAYSDALMLLLKKDYKDL